MTRNKIRVTIDSLERIAEFTTDTGLAVTAERSLWLLRAMAKLYARPSHLGGGMTAKAVSKVFADIDSERKAAKP